MQSEPFVIKKDGRREAWKGFKVTSAIIKASERAGIVLTEEQRKEVLRNVWMAVALRYSVPVAELHDLVEKELAKVCPTSGMAYASLRNYKQDIGKVWEGVYKNSDRTLRYGDTENANFNSSLSSTKGVLIRGHLTKELYKQFYLSPQEKEAIEQGFIYIHDLRDLIFGGVNCCLFDIETVLKGGFEMAGVRYKEPKSVLSALQVIGDVTLVSTAQQFGGFTLAELDKVLVPYVLKSYQNHSADAFKWGSWSNGSAHEYAKFKTIEEIKQGLQSLEMKLNTVPSSRGDTAFVTVSFGNVDGSVSPKWQREICHAILNTRMTGQGNGSPVVFPKLVYLHSEKQHLGLEQKWLFAHAVECSSKCMYPDYLSLDNSEVGEIYHRTGKVVSPMGCRAYLSDYKDENGESFFVGRANIGAVSLNLPMIWMEAKGNQEAFRCSLDSYLQMIRSFLKRRYTTVAESLCSTNPLAFTQGGFRGGHKKPTDKVGMDIVKGFTASFGITSLNELNVLATGKELHEGSQEWILSVVDYIKDTVEEFKKEDGFLYALYGTPAESLAGTQLKQFRKRYGVVPKVSDREYFSNSFHCHVAAPINPFEKQGCEHALYHKISGGHIQYVRIENRRNLKALHTIIKRGMQLGYYQGVNFDLVVCEDCGCNPEKPSYSHEEVCPECGSKDITVISRVCGYLGIQLSKGQTRFNEAKLEEVKERVSM